MRQTFSTLGRAVCGIALLALASSPVRADTAYVADFSTPTLDPALRVIQLQEGVFKPGVAGPWSVSTGSGALVLAKTVSPLGGPYPDGPHVGTKVAVTGDFVATVTADSTANGAGGGGFFLDINGGYTGMSFGVNWLNDSAGQGFDSTGYSAVATPLITLEIRRIGDTLTKSYKLDGQAGFTQVSSLTDSNVIGLAWFDLTNYGGLEAATALSFTSFSVLPLAAPVPEPETYAMLLAGLGLIGMASRRRVRSAT